MSFVTCINNFSEGITTALNSNLLSTAARRGGGDGNRRVFEKAPESFKLEV